MTTPTRISNPGPDEARNLINQAIEEKKRVVIQYLDSSRLVTPRAVANGVLTGEVDSTRTSGHVRQFRLEFIREIVLVSADDGEMVDQLRDVVAQTREALAKESDERGG